MRGTRPLGSESNSRAQSAGGLASPTPSAEIISRTSLTWKSATQENERGDVGVVFNIEATGAMVRIRQRRPSRPHRRNHASADSAELHLEMPKSSARTKVERKGKVPVSSLAIFFCDHFHRPVPMVIGAAIRATVEQPQAMRQRSDAFFIPVMHGVSSPQR